MPRVGEDVDDAVVLLDFLMRHATGKHDLVRDAELRGKLLQRLFLRAAADEQHPHLGHSLDNHRQRREQQIQAFVGVERADEPHDQPAVEAQSPLQGDVRLGVERECGQVDGIGNDRDPALGNPACHDVALQPFADRRDVIGAPQREGLERAGQPVAQAPLPTGAVVDGRILPERTHLVDDRNPHPPADHECGQRIEHWRVGVEDRRACEACDLA